MIVSNNSIRAFVKRLLIILAMTLFAASSIGAQSMLTVLQQNKWNHGSADCQSNADPAIEVFRFDQSSYILRQNKCLNFEAPFIYVLFGDKTVLVLDTGATESEAQFPLYETVKSLMKQQSGDLDLSILVLHSHSHSDHYKGDVQFTGKPNVTVIAPNSKAVAQFFAFDLSPNGEFYIDLGGRELTVLQTPGHQEEAIAVYDQQTRWLLTGDTFYPGYIYVKDWPDYKKSIARLFSFSVANDISAVLGAHIEMTDKAGEYYEIGTTFQPSEASLVLHPDKLAMLHSALNDLQRQEKISSDEFIVAPMNFLQKSISNIARWIVQ